MAAVTVATGLDSTVMLNDGLTMPLFGLGVFLSEAGDNGEAENAVIHALKYGYLLVDTAEFYRNETDVGHGVEKSGMKREDVFVVSKIWQGNGYDECQKTFRAALERLGMEYIDLYLIHSPYGEKNCDTYRAMIDLQKEGLIRSCGVSNFGVHHLEGLKKAGLPTPSVNQIELHPWQKKPEIVEYCRRNGITVMGWSPLAKGQKINDPIIVEMGKRYGKSPAMVLIRWSVQKGFITIPKSVKPSRIEENAQVFDWALSEEDMKKLGSLPDESCTGSSWNPTASPWNG